MNRPHLARVISLVSIPAEISAMGLVAGQEGVF